MSRMLGIIREHGSRRQYQEACHYAAWGRVESIEAIYRKVVGQ